MPAPAPPVSREALEAEQLARLRELVGALVPANRFWTARLAAAGLDRGVAVLDDLRRLPPVTKDELVADQERHPPWGSGLTFPVARYVRFHQTSGTTGRPLRWLDTAESWGAMLDVWERVFAGAGVGAGERVFFPFSFGPFLGFWTAFDAAVRLGATAVPGGGLSSKGRVRLLAELGAAAVCCTPTYAVHLAEVAAAEDVDLAACGVRAVIVAGEPGGAVAATRRRIADAWGGARVVDHHGMTEVGPVSVASASAPDVLHVVEGSFVAEVVDPSTLAPVAPGEPGELLLTTLRRVGSPLLRYRTGDLVRRSARPAEELGTPELALEGGILGRLDDMVVVRGVNLYPGAVEAVVRRHPEVAEYRVELASGGALAEVRLEVEPVPGVADPAALARRLADDLKAVLQVRIPVAAVAAGSLPRFEMKARRWVKTRAEASSAPTSV